METRKEILALGNGSIMRCIFTASDSFHVGEDYATNTAMFCGLPDIEIDRYSVNYHRNGYFGIEGHCLLAKFVLIRDNSGRYVKRARYLELTSRPSGKQDKRRLRRYVSQMLKNDNPGSYEHRVINRLYRNLMGR